MDVYFIKGFKPKLKRISLHKYKNELSKLSWKYIPYQLMKVAIN